MRANHWIWVTAITALLAFLPPATDVAAQTVEDLRQRIQELERSTREQIDALRRLIEQREAERAQERRAQEERERAYEVLREQVERQQLSLRKQEEAVARVLDGWENFFDLEAGRKQSTGDAPPLGREVQGNVYTGDKFKVRLGGSIRLHTQSNDTPVPEAVSTALLPDPTVPGGGNNGGRDNFRSFASGTRLNLAVEGPATFEGKTQGLVEIDFFRNSIGGESGAVSPNPRLRHAFGRWIRDDLFAAGDEFTLTFGQTVSFADNLPDTADANAMRGGLGAASKRNPRFELLHKYPLTSNLRFVSSLGAERPFFGNDFIGTDLGPGDLSGFPALSAGVGLESGRLGEGFGIGRSAAYVRTTWGEFEERFTSEGTASLGATTNFSERHFTNQTAWGTVTLERIGLNKTGRAMTLELRGGGLWTRGDALHLDATFDRRVIIDDDGQLVPAESVGAFVNALFFITDTLSLRWAGGTQFALDSDRPVAAGTLTSDFFRVNNRQSEFSIFWTPGPFTFGLSYNHTATNFKRVPSTGGSESRENENNKIELITWFSF
ncbi:MAG: hypothetical protein HY727_03085 [Candidatus Rokubacteria bacterium]|nr:hypothetical protein [Candidatus Rokubacteria bacterium]